MSSVDNLKYRDRLDKEVVEILDNVFSMWKLSGYKIYEFRNGVHIDKSNGEMFILEFFFPVREVVIRQFTAKHSESGVYSEMDRGKIDDIDFFKSLVDFL